MKNIQPTKNKNKKQQIKLTTKKTEQPHNTQNQTKNKNCKNINKTK